MSFKLALARLLHPIESHFDRLKGLQDGPVSIESYDGYTTPEGVRVRARILTARDPREHRADQSKLRNALQFLQLFATDEHPNLPVRIKGTSIKAVSDDEGYVDLLVPRAALPSESMLILEAGEVERAIEIHDVPDGASFGVISDIDDTMMQTGARSIWLNLWTSFTGNPSTRVVFDDARSLMDRKASRNVPVFYVSSSPWNLYSYLRSVFRRAGLPSGPMFLRDLGLSPTQFVTGTHGDHKGQAIAEILAAAPGLTFDLIGDTGQHDAEIYGRIAEHYPDRVRRIILRQAAPVLAPEMRAAIEAARARGVTVEVVPSFDLLAT